jgi:hypothetical protein
MAHTTHQKTEGITASGGGQNVVGNTNDHANQHGNRNSIHITFDKGKNSPKTTIAFVALVAVLVVTVGVSVPLSLESRGSAAS